MHVKDGATIVIGGLTHRETVDRENRIPYLSDIPWIGHLFKQIDKQEQEAEVVVFISPRIVRSGEKEFVAAELDESDTEP